MHDNCRDDARHWRGTRSQPLCFTRCQYTTMLVNLPFWAQTKKKIKRTLFCLLFFRFGFLFRFTWKNKFIFTENKKKVVTNVEKKKTQLLRRHLKFTTNQKTRTCEEKKPSFDILWRSDSCRFHGRIRDVFHSGNSKISSLPSSGSKTGQQIRRFLSGQTRRHGRCSQGNGKSSNCKYYSTSARAKLSTR